MKRYQYQTFNIRAMIEQRRLESFALNNISDDVIYHDILNELGAVGWDLTASNDILFFGKRELVQDGLLMGPVD